MDVNAKAAKAACDEEEFARFLTEYKPFIATCAHKAAGRRVSEHDDEMSVAMIAFSEAVKRYKPGFGSFLPYASKVIRSRLIDWQREENRNVSAISIDSASTGYDRVPSDPAVERRLSVNANSRFDNPVKLEIEALTQELVKYGFDFFSVAKCSPKAVKTKAACKRAARHLVAKSTLLDELTRTKQIPVQKLSEEAGVSRKTIGRHRNYIVCLALILSGEYECLAEYING